MPFFIFYFKKNNKIRTFFFKYGQTPPKNQSQIVKSDVIDESPNFFAIYLD